MLVASGTAAAPELEVVVVVRQLAWPREVQQTVAVVLPVTAGAAADAASSQGDHHHHA